LFLITILSLCFFAAFPVASYALQPIIVSINLNQEAKGVYFVNLADDGDVLVKTEDLISMGVSGPFPKPVEIANESYLSLRSFAGVTFVFDENKLSLDITAAPTLLPKKVVDFAPQQPLKVYYPRDTSAFLNYRLDYSTGDFSRFQNLGVANELGIRSGDLLLLSDSVYTKTDTDSRFVRLSSSLIYDRRQEMQRFIGGDFSASSGDLGTGVLLGGFSFSRLYRINPYFINRPTAGLSGLVSLPSTMEVYLNGTRIRTDSLSPGEFELRNITGYGGASQVDVVIRDSFGREQRIQYPFYFSDILLKKGQHEYSYNVGALRREYGTTSNHYGTAAFSGFHNYGLSDSLTLGFRGEWAGSTFNLGPQASFLTPRAGTFTMSLSGSHTGTRTAGGAALFGYNYQGDKFNTRLFLKGFSRDYATIDTGASALKTQYMANVGAGYGTRGLGTLNLDYAAARIYQGDSTRAATASYSRSLIANASINISYKRVLSPVADNQFFIGLNYYPGRQINLAANFQRASDTNTETLTVQKNQPFGEGVGFQTTLERGDSSSLAVNRFSPSIQYNGPHGVYAADYSWSSSNGDPSESARLAVSGALAYAGKTIGLTRPITDSFALVKVGEVEGVGVNLNNQEVARTDGSGKAFVTGLGAFNYNQISVNDKDIPMDYLLSAKMKQVSPLYRSGSCVIFDASKLQAFTGVLVAKIGTESKPLEYGEITVTIDGKPVVFQSGSGGEFYLDNYSVSRDAASDLQEQGCSALDKAGVASIKPGRYLASVNYEGKRCMFNFEIPRSTDPIIDLGKISCESTPGGGLPPPAAPPPQKTEKTLSAPVSAPVSEKVAAAPELWQAGQPLPLKKADDVAPSKTVVPRLPIDADISVPEEIVLHFRFGSDKFSSNDDVAEILKVARLLQTAAGLSVSLEGYTDQIGSVEYNLQLGKKRAFRVERELLKDGVDSKKITAVTSFGKKQLKCRSLREKCRKQNRRVIVYINRN
jgi:outer membrane usher protein FimD/PapC/outer membrane protein OmpA-like peptidoglycan-associated protein